MMNFTNRQGICGGVSSELMADCTRASHTSEVEVEYFRQSYKKLIRWVILSHPQHKSQYKMRPLIVELKNFRIF